jgi:hypothetical protein
MSATELLASTKFETVEDRESIRLAVTLDSVKTTNGGSLFIVDATQAEQGLAAIRRSVTEAQTYEHKWVDAGMPMLSTWLKSSSAVQEGNGIPLPVKRLISSILTSAIRNVEAEAALESRSNAARNLTPATQFNLNLAIDEFSRNAHQELQSGLASAWRSRNLLGTNCSGVLMMSA